MEIVNINDPATLTAWRYGSGDDSKTKLLTPAEATARVALLFRAVDVRANAVSRIPYALLRGGTDITASDDGLRITKSLTTRLYQIEAARLLYGFAYIGKDRNRAGIVYPRWFAPQSVTPNYGPIGVVNFKRVWTDAAGVEHDKTINLKDIIYSWVPNFTDDIGPGIPAIDSALGAASALAMIDQFTVTYIGGGASKKHVLLIDGANPPQKEKDELESRWTRFIRSMATAFAIKKTVTPFAVGSDLKDTDLPNMIDRFRDDVTLGVPMSLLKSGASNYATANQDWINLYDLYVLPEVGQIFEALNEQWLRIDENCEIVEQHDRLLVYQIFKAASGLTAAPPAATDAPSDAPADDLTDAAMMADEAQADLKKWERKALNAMGAGKSASVPFTSDAIGEAQHGEISAALTECKTFEDVRRVFSQTSADDVLARAVRELARANTLMERGQ